MDAKTTFLQYLDDIRQALLDLNAAPDSVTFVKINQMKQFFEEAELDDGIDVPDADNLPLNNFGDDDTGMFLTAIFGDQSVEEKRNIESELIDIYWPGRESLTDEELMKEKYYTSQHLFQFVISLKRYVEATGKGWVEPIEHGWSFGQAGGL